MLYQMTGILENMTQYYKKLIIWFQMIEMYHMIIHMIILKELQKFIKTEFFLINTRLQAFQF